MAWTNTLIPTEMSGGHKVVMINCDPDAATTTIDMTGYGSAIKGALATFIGDATGNCYSISTSISSLTLTVKLWKAGGTAADTAYVDLTVLVVMAN